MKDLIFKAEEISVKLSYFNEASKVIDSLSDNVKYCVIADAKVFGETTTGPITTSRADSTSQRSSKSVEHS